MKKRKGINSRSKGVRFEQECSKLWAEVMGHNFRRTRGSGSGIICGDIAPYSENQEEVMKWIQEFPFTVECKNNEHAELHHLLVNPVKSFIWKSWLQAEDNAFRSEKIPFLMFTKNNYPILCMVTTQGMARLSLLVQELHGISSWEIPFDANQDDYFPYNNIDKFKWTPSIKERKEQLFVIFKWIGTGKDK